MESGATAVNRFIVTAKHFVEVCRTPSSAETVHRALVGLYTAALDLPDWQSAKDERFPEVAAPDFRWLPFQYYRSISDPLQLSDDRSAMGDLGDDLGDTLVEIEAPLKALDANTASLEGAVKRWKTSFLTLWGRRAIDSIGALHAHLARTER